LLRSYVDTALLRDVIERHAVSNPVALRWMVRHLLANPAGSFSVNKFYGDLRSQNIPVANDTLHAYLGHLEDAFLIRTVSMSSGSERQRMVNPRKAYPPPAASRAAERPEMPAPTTKTSASDTVGRPAAAKADIDMQIITLQRRPVWMRHASETIAQQMK